MNFPSSATLNSLRLRFEREENRCLGAISKEDLRIFLTLDSHTFKTFEYILSENWGFSLRMTSRMNIIKLSENIRDFRFLDTRALVVT